MVARSFTLRAVIAFVLLAIFYVSALATGLGLVALAFWTLTISKSLNIQAVLMIAGAGVAVLAGLVPSFTKWRAPGIKVDEREQPRLFGLIRQVSQQMTQPMPAEVYLVAEVNAFVEQVGGVIGLGGKRILGLGLPLLEVTNLSQLKAILAHEFGHFAGGDTRLSALTRVTRGAMIRTLDNAERSGGGFLVRPLGWIFRIYLRITQAISRQQELLADEWAVRIAGKTALASGLRQSQLGGARWSHFKSSEVEPLATRGIAPNNLLEGFRAYSSSGAMKSSDQAIQTFIAQQKPDAYDSHPSLAERIAWAHAQPGDAALDTTPATSLLENRPALEGRLSEAPPGLTVKSWTDLGPIYGADLEARGARAQVRVEGLTVQRALDVLSQPATRDAFAEAIDPLLTRWTLPDRRARLNEAIATALEGYFGQFLTARGFSWQTSPGEPLWLQRADTTIALRALLVAILEGEEPAAALAQTLDVAGVSPTESLQVEEKLRWKLERPRSEVKLQPQGSYVIVLVEFATFRLPQCCGVCMRPAAQVTRTVMRGMFGPEGIVLDVPTCSEHEGQENTVLSVRSWRPIVGELGFEVKDPKYAELIQTVNG